MGICNDINKLKPEFKPILKWIIEKGKSEYNVDLKVNETFRTQEIQEAYYVQGRNNLEVVNRIRKAVGLWGITESENSRTITNVYKISELTGHGAGLAADLVPDGKWNSSLEKWSIIGKLCQEANRHYSEYLRSLNAEIAWGGTWNMSRGGNDAPHVELRYK